MQNLVEVALGDLFPEQCEEWLSTKKYIQEVFIREQKERKSAIVRDLADAEDLLQHALREEIVDRVIQNFPYVLFQSCLDQAERVYLIQLVGSWCLPFKRTWRGRKY